MRLMLLAACAVFGLAACSENDRAPRAPAAAGDDDDGRRDDARRDDDRGDDDRGRARGDDDDGGRDGGSDDEG